VVVLPLTCGQCGRCNRCRLIAKDPRYAALFPPPSTQRNLARSVPHGGVASSVSPVRRPLPCLHLGIVISRASCTCPRLNVRECTAGHGRVTQARECETCSDYEADSPHAFGSIAKRHLVYHILPIAGNGSWQRGVDQLRLRWGLFTGSKIAAVMTGFAGARQLDSPDDVRDYLPCDCEVIEIANNPALREVASWVPLWERVLAVAGDEDAILYAHAKAVTRQVDPGNSCQWWASLMYSLHLDHWSLVADQLVRYPITGAFKKVGHGFGGSRSAWHYSGTFFWVRAGDVQSRPWRGIDQLWFGAEAWPGTAYPSDEAGNLFLDGRVPQLDLYSPGFWDRVVRPRYSEWLSQNPPSFPWMENPTLATASPSAAT
jgi:hypothetical protein